MDNDFRPHLLIPELEVEHIENKPQARSKNRGLDRFEHGTRLSTGLEEIVSAYTRVQSSDSLCEEDIRLFEVVLPTDMKFSNKTLRDFLNQEGMTITSVRDPRHAIVSTPQGKFESLQRRVGNYRDSQKSNRMFQDIEDFRFPDPMEKQSLAIRKLIEEAGDVLLDVEIREEMLIDQIGPEGQARVEQHLIQRIKDSAGQIISHPYRLSDDTPIIRAKVALNQLKNISEDTVVCHVAPTGLYGIVPAYCIDAPQSIHLDPTVRIEELPIVAVLDTGVDFPAELEPLVITHWVPSGTTGGNKVHGTNVASKVAFANVGNQMSKGVLTPRARIIDCNKGRGAEQKTMKEAT